MGYKEELAQAKKRFGKNQKGFLSYKALLDKQYGKKATSGGTPKKRARDRSRSIVKKKAKPATTTPEIEVVGGGTASKKPWFIKPTENSIKIVREMYSDPSYFLTNHLDGSDIHNKSIGRIQYPAMYWEEIPFPYITIVKCKAEESIYIFCEKAFRTDLTSVEHYDDAKTASVVGQSGLRYIFFNVKWSETINAFLDEYTPEQYAASSNPPLRARGETFGVIVTTSNWKYFINPTTLKAKKGTDIKMEFDYVGKDGDADKRKDGGGIISIEESFVSSDFKTIIDYTNMTTNFTKVGYTTTTDGNGVEYSALKSLIYPEILAESSTFPIVTDVMTDDPAASTSSVEAAAEAGFKLPYPDLKEVSSPFGWRKYPKGGKLQFHTGVDFKCLKWNTPIGSPEDGEIVSVGHTNVKVIPKATYVSIKGKLSGYIHIFKHVGAPGYKISGIKVGTKVKAGDNIGVANRSGLTSGPHLHWEIYHPDNNYIFYDVMKCWLEKNLPEQHKKIEGYKTRSWSSISGFKAWHASNGKDAGWVGKFVAANMFKQALYRPTAQISDGSKCK